MKQSKLNFGNQWSVLWYLALIIPIGFVQTAHAQDNFSKVPGRKKILEKRWTLVKILKISEGVSRDISHLILPCKEDDFLQYESDGSYKIYENEVTCHASSSQIVGEGTWELQGENMLIDRYQGGKAIEKQIDTLENDKLVISHRIRGNARIRSIYYSQEVIQNPSFAEKIVKSNSKINQLQKIATHVIQREGRYILADYKQLPLVPEWDQLSPKAKPFKKKILVFPFQDMRDSLRTSESLNTKMDFFIKAKQSEVDFILSGKIRNVETEMKENGPVAEIFYELEAWDVRKEKLIHSKVFSKKYNGAITTSILKGFVTGLGVATAVTSDDPETATEILNLTNDLNSLIEAGDLAYITGGDSVEITENIIIQDAIEKVIQKTEKDITSFLQTHAPLYFQLNKVAARNPKNNLISEIKVEAGTFAEVKDKEKLGIIRFIGDTLSNGDINIREKVIAKVSVSEILGTELLIAKVVSGKDELTDLKDNSDEELMARTLPREGLINKSLIWEKIPFDRADFQFSFQVGMASSFAAGDFIKYHQSFFIESLDSEESYKGQVSPIVAPTFGFSTVYRPFHDDKIGNLGFLMGASYLRRGFVSQFTYQSESSAGDDNDKIIYKEKYVMNQISIPIGIRWGKEVYAELGITLDYVLNGSRVSSLRRNKKGDKAYDGGFTTAERERENISKSLLDNRGRGFFLSVGKQINYKLGLSALGYYSYPSLFNTSQGNFRNISLSIQLVYAI